MDDDLRTPEGDLFSPEEIALIQQVRQSRIWATIAHALRCEREALLAKKTETRDDVLLTWGAVQQLTTLLNSGPVLVVYSDRLRREEGKTHG